MFVKWLFVHLIAALCRMKERNLVGQMSMRRDGRRFKTKCLLIIGDNLGTGGQQLYYLNLSRHLRSKGWNIVYTYMENSKSGKQWETIWQEMGECIALGGTGSLRRIYDWIPNMVNIKKLCHLCLQKQINLILTGSSWSRFLGSIISKIMKIPMVNLPGSTWHLSRRYKLIGKYSRAIHSSYGYVSSSHQQRIDYIDVGVEPRRIIHTHHGTDLERFKPNSVIRNKMRQKLCYSKSDIVLGYGGRLSPEKGLMSIIETIAKLRNEAQSWHLLCVGDGPQKEQLIERARALNLEKCVTITGFVSNPNEYYSSIDCAIQYCSYAHGGKFNLGTFTVEAMASGVPILHYVPAKICEGYEEGISGFFVDCGEIPEVLFHRLLDLGKQPEKLLDMGNAARAFALQHYDIKDTLNTIEIAFVSLIEGFWPDGSKRILG